MAQTKTGKNLLKKIERIEGISSIRFWMLETVLEYGKKVNEKTSSVDIEIYIKTLEEYDSIVQQVLEEFPNSKFEKSFDGHKTIELKNIAGSQTITFELKGLPKEDIAKILGCEQLIEKTTTYTTLSCKIG